MKSITGYNRLAATAIVVCLCVYGTTLCDGVLQNEEEIPQAEVLKERILGGKNASITKFPHMLAVLVDGYLTGGAALLNKRWAIGAAYSASFAPHPSNMTIRAGSNSAFKGGIISEVKRIIIHPRWRGWENDIALIQLERPIKYGKTVRPISMAGKLPRNGARVLFSGYGTRQAENDNENTDFLFDGVLKEVEMEYFSYKRCSKYYNETLYFTTNSFCTGTTKDTSPFARDFGGPLLYKNKVIGVFSGVRRCDGIIKPAVYANLVQKRKWIRETLRKHSHNDGDTDTDQMNTYTDELD